MNTDTSLERFFATITPDPLGHAFARRPPMVHRGDARLVPDEKVSEVWKSLQADPRSGKRVVYLPIPFCTSRCSFRGFYKNRSDTGTISAYVECLIDELELDAESVSEAGRHRSFPQASSPGYLRRFARSSRLRPIAKSRSRGVSGIFPARRLLPVSRLAPTGSRLAFRASIRRFGANKDARPLAMKPSHT